MNEKIKIELTKTAVSMLDDLKQQMINLNIPEISNRFKKMNYSELTYILNLGFSEKFLFEGLGTASEKGFLNFGVFELGEGDIKIISKAIDNIIFKKFN